MTKDEALRMALAALEAHADIGIKSDKAITAIKETLAQPEQKPYGYVWTSIRDNMEVRFSRIRPTEFYKPTDIKPVYTTPPQTDEFKCPLCYDDIANIKNPSQPEQEPVAWLYIEPDNPHLNVHYDDVDVSQFPHDEWFPVYKSPPQRTWVGLTDEEIGTIAYNVNPLDGIRQFSRAIEAKLKEKNT
jgi:hypothetical protein